MSDEEPPVPEEVLTSAKDQLDDEAILLADNEGILHALSELTPVYENEREGNKSGRPRLLPIDDELGNRLERYLLVRPDNGEPWLVLSQKSHTRMTSKGINGVWKDAFHPQYAETDEHRPVTSHFGRHRFTTYWRVEQDLNRQLVKYMRGDRTGAYENSKGMNAYYEDIEGLYRKGSYQLGL